MIFRFPAWKEWVCFFTLTLCSILCTARVRADSLHIGEYIQQLEKSRSAENFNAVFSDFITNFKSGKVAPFSETEVMALITIARNKPFVESLLPAVYGWALTVFGDGRMDERYLFHESAEVTKENRSSPRP